MLLVFRALLVLGLVSLLHAAKRPRGRAVSVRLGQGGGPRGKIVRLVMDPSVLPMFSNGSSWSIANMSLSPWTYRESCVTSRFPRRIAKAQCLTSGCLNLQGEGEDAALEAKPIYYQALVFYKVPRPSGSNKTGKKSKRVKYDLRLGTEMIPVGCTCVRPSVVPQQ
ncbi:interleukin 17a/f3 [Stegastes partitus]|uniref:Interleukin-17F-like n=1 Tax=Stegastes partitus TaxID=144197 RepID=A0A3B5B9Y8_9TELE|nr:PREDICTED: interleukin-17F-like [Stegastes partitus]